MHRHACGSSAISVIFGLFPYKIIPDKESSVGESAGTIESTSCRGKNGEQTDVTTMMAVGEIQAHANGIAGLAIMMTTGARHSSSSRTAPCSAEEGNQEEEGVGGLLVTCGNAEGVVKIWDYTHVEDDGSCGRYVCV